MDVTEASRGRILGQMYDLGGSASAYAGRYITHMSEVVRMLDVEAIGKAAEVIEKCADEDKTFFVMGNGGSGAVAAHWVNDLGANTVVPGKPGFRTISLTDNSCSITAIANDVCYEEIFSIQLAAGMRPGDVVLALSVSGNSPNIVRAVEYANSNGGFTIGCSGMQGGKLRDLAQLSIHIPSSQDEYGPVEDMFSIVMHVIQSYISMRRGRYLAH